MLTTEKQYRPAPFREEVQKRHSHAFTSTRNSRAWFETHTHQSGNVAIIRMSAFNLRATPELNGYVSRVAADLATDERAGISYYLVRLSVPHAELTKLKDLTLVPGMPAEAMVQTGERTALSYLVKPLSDQISRAFREE